jgi:hypothetical protein
MPNTKPRNIPIEVASRNPYMEHPKGIQPIELEQNEKVKNNNGKESGWQKAWQKIKNFRNNFNKKNRKTEQNPKNQNALASAIKEKFEKVIDFNRLSIKEKAEIIAIAMLALGVVVASSAFIYPTIAGLTAAGTYGVGAAGTFGTYNYLALLGTVEFAKSTAGVLVVKSGVAAAGAGLLATGFGLANRGDKLTKKYTSKLPPKQLNLNLEPHLKAPIPTIKLNNSKQSISPYLQIITPDNPIKDTGEAYRFLDLGNLKTRYNNIMSSEELSEEQKNSAIDFMLNAAYLRFKTGAKDVEIDQAIQICNLTNNFEIWQKITKEINIRNGLSRSQMDLSRKRFEKTSKNT